jgi:hypothetical protein
MTTRFDLEQQILDCWKVTDDIEQVADSIMEGTADSDTVNTMLCGMFMMYNLKFQKLFETMEKLIANKNLQ